jgi:hypothetical protein
LEFRDDILDRIDLIPISQLSKEVPIVSKILVWFLHNLCRNSIPPPEKVFILNTFDITINNCNNTLLFFLPDTDYTVLNSFKQLVSKTIQFYPSSHNKIHRLFYSKHF